MNAAEWHLALNHLPIAGSLIGTLVLALGIAKKERILSRVALVILVLSSLISIPVIETGESAEHLLEETGQYSDTLIHEHEEAAEQLAWILRAMGLLALISYFVSFEKHRWGRPLRILVLLSGLASIFFGYQVAHEGGKINHPELQETQTSQAQG